MSAPRCANASGGGGRRTAPRARDGRITVATPGVTTCPRWLVALTAICTTWRPSITDLPATAPGQRGAPADARSAGHPAGAGLRAAQVVEGAHLVGQLPQPGVVAHSIGREVGEPA